MVSWSAWGKVASWDGRDGALIEARLFGDI